MLELFGTASCQYTAELREELEWRSAAFVEYDVDSDAAARSRMLDLTHGNRTVPVLVEDGAIKQVGVGGRGCFINGP